VTAFAFIARTTAASMLTLLPTLVAQQTEISQTPTFRAATSLVLVDVITKHPKNGLPVRDLKREDFQIFDNGRAVQIITFDTGTRYETRPIALWFVVICNEKGNAEGSGWLLGKEALLRSALEHLDQRDRVGVAHWCDNGDAQLDLRPGEDRNLALTALGEALEVVPFARPPTTRIGELAFQRMVRLIIEDANQQNPQPLPVIVLLHGDHTGMPPKELNALVDDFLETSGIVFGIKDSAIPEQPPLGNTEIASIFHYMSLQTGGEYVSAPPSLYALALESILVQLHFRYELGFKPPAVDGKRHKLKVELVGEAHNRYRALRLRYRPAYIPMN